MICLNSVCVLKEQLETGETCQDLMYEEIAELQDDLQCPRAYLACDGRPRVELSAAGHGKCQEIQKEYGENACEICRA